MFRSQGEKSRYSVPGTKRVHLTGSISSCDVGLSCSSLRVSLASLMFSGEASVVSARMPRV